MYQCSSTGSWEYSWCGRGWLVGPGHDDLGEGYEEGGVRRRREEVAAAAMRAVVTRPAPPPAHLRTHHHAAVGRAGPCQPYVSSNGIPFDDVLSSISSMFLIWNLLFSFVFNALWRLPHTTRMKFIKAPSSASTLNYWVYNIFVALSVEVATTV